MPFDRDACRQKLKGHANYVIEYACKFVAESEANQGFIDAGQLFFTSPSVGATEDQFAWSSLVIFDVEHPAAAQHLKMIRRLAAIDFCHTFSFADFGNRDYVIGAALSLFGHVCYGRRRLPPEPGTNAPTFGEIERLDIEAVRPEVRALLPTGQIKIGDVEIVEAIAYLHDRSHLFTVSAGTPRPFTIHMTV